MKIQKLKLGNVITLEYGKPLPPSVRKSNGTYPVYGANGIKSRSDLTYVNNPSIIVGRKGSAGELNLTEEKFWPLDVTYFVMFDEKKYDLQFLYRLLSSLGLPKLAKGVKPGLNRNDVYSISVEIPESIDDQKRITRKIDAADTLRQKRKQAMALLDEYLKAVFLEMFGDPVANSKGWEKKPLNFFGSIITGNTPPRNDVSNYSTSFIEWIKTDNILADKIYVTSSTEHLSEMGLNRARSVMPGAVLVACIAGSVESIGRAAITDRKVSFNQQINAIQPNDRINTFFLYWLLKISKRYIQSHATKGMKRILTKGSFEKIIMILPPTDLQNKFAEIVAKTERLKQAMLIQSDKLEGNFNALMQKSFL